MRQTLVAVLLLVVPFLSNARHEGATGRRDGNWWRQQTTNSKADYMVGFIDGMRLGNYSSYAGNKDTRCLGLALNSYLGNREKFFDNVTNGQLVDGLDTFYKDDPNRSIRVTWAVWVVVNGIAGTPKDELDKMIENWRKNALRD